MYPDPRHFWLHVSDEKLGGGGPGNEANMYGMVTS